MIPVSMLCAPDALNDVDIVRFRPQRNAIRLTPPSCPMNSDDDDRPRNDSFERGCNERMQN
jgi:hypothetical protein